MPYGFLRPVPRLLCSRIAVFTLRLRYSLLPVSPTLLVRLNLKSKLYKVRSTLRYSLLRHLYARGFSLYTSSFSFTRSQYAKLSTHKSTSSVRPVGTRLVHAVRTLGDAPTTRQAVLLLFSAPPPRCQPANGRLQLQCLKLEPLKFIERRRRLDHLVLVHSKQLPLRPRHRLRDV